MSNFQLQRYQFNTTPGFEVLRVIIVNFTFSVIRCSTKRLTFSCLNCVLLHELDGLFLKSGINVQMLLKLNKGWFDIYKEDNCLLHNVKFILYS